MTTDEKIEALQAFKRDGKVQCRHEALHNEWTTTGDPVWSFNIYDYRPVPVAREWFLNVFGHTGNAYSTRDEAVRSKASSDIRTVKVVEVLDGD